MRQLENEVFVAGQILSEDVAGLAAAGFGVIIDNRPDGEEIGQPPGSEIAAAAEAAGVGYRHIPIAGSFSPDQVAEMAEALGGAEKVLAFCRSGTRSTYLWALARAQQGVPPEELIERAGAAGYDLAPIAAYLR